MVELLLGGCSVIVLHLVMLNAPFTFTMGEGIALSTVCASKKFNLGTKDIPKCQIYAKVERRASLSTATP